MDLRCRLGQHHWYELDDEEKDELTDLEVAGKIPLNGHYDRICTRPGCGLKQLGIFTVDWDEIRRWEVEEGLHPRLDVRERQVPHGIRCFFGLHRWHYPTKREIERLEEMEVTRQIPVFGAYDRICERCEEKQGRLKFNGKWIGIDWGRMRREEREHSEEEARDLELFDHP